jgi:3-oxoacyl-[acyl-carrier-protein] synthase III
VKDMRMKGAGLTIGNGAACLMLTREPLAGGGLRLLATDTYTDPSHWELCQVPIGGKFSSSSVELMRLGKLIPPVTKRNLDGLGLSPDDIQHYVFHQPSEIMVRKIIQDIGADPARGVYTHHLYGNTASASVAITFDHLLKDREVKDRDKIVLGSAAAGFSAVMVTGEWTVARP